MEILVLLLMYILVMCKFKKKSNTEKILISVFYLYLCCVLYVTILPLDLTPDFKWLYHESVPVDYGNFVPFEDLLKNRHGAMKGILLNIIMTMPFGFLMSIIFLKVNFLKVLVSTFMLSLSIEVFQLITTIFLLHHRAFDVTDLITNTFGGIIGYFIYKLTNRNSFITNLVTTTTDNQNTEQIHPRKSSN
ncbi:MAG: VanZ family protein [Eubacteriales bacterium]